MAGNKVGAIPAGRVRKDSAGDAVGKRESAAQIAARRKKSLEREEAARLAQVVNLHIAGFSLADIGAAIGSTAEEVDRMLANDTARYVRSQPALRTYVRNYISGKYTKLLEAVWETASDKDAPAEQKLAHQDRAVRILERMARLHGADAPTQTEVTLDVVPENVDKMVRLLSQAQGIAYDTEIFDAEVVEDLSETAQLALESSAQALEQPQEGEETVI
jgi:hypothetical protein